MSNGAGQLSPPWTILKVLRWTAGYFEHKGIDDTPRLDAELLLAHVLDIDRVKLYARFDQPLQEAELNEFKVLMKRRLAGEPVAYITEHQQFWSLDLKVDRRALIPRPETGKLVSRVLDIIDEDDEVSVLDIGTGTGAIALALASERSNIEVTATDVSEDVLELAAENVESLDFEDRVEIVKSDLFENIDGNFDIIVSNPPYVSEQAYEEEVSDSIREHEPREALEAGAEGLDILDRLVPEAVEYLEEDGYLAVEIGYDQAEVVTELFDESGFEDIEVVQDEAGHDRVVLGRGA